MQFLLAKKKNIGSLWRADRTTQALANKAAGKHANPTFVVTISRKDLNESFGIVITFSEKGQEGLLIKDVTLTDGPVSEWNAKHPSQAVRGGSVIHAINGYSLLDDMLRELRSSHRIEMLVSTQTSRIQQQLLKKSQDTTISALAFQALPCKEACVCNTDVCAICLEDCGADEQLLQLPCGHAFHNSCVKTWLLTRSRQCPLCKQTMQTAARSTNVSSATTLRRK
eukprot:TRINITY_DN9942_c0_g1_i2.p1 TRINITY_DN9942_c0_g1~~TRINITY_DN9942_c0_g1_i2.p1  ORF type:complete len:236 (-),score=38.55 TRINITY_DN9942_c0_g1_i2:75-749(-)